MLQAIADATILKKVHELGTKIESLKREVELKSEGLDGDLTLAGIVAASSKILNARLDALETGRKRIEGERKRVRISLQKVERELGRFSGTKDDLEDKIHTLTEAGTDDTIECPTCAKPLSSDDRERHVSEYKTTIETGESSSIQALACLEFTPH